MRKKLAPRLLTFNRHLQKNPFPVVKVPIISFIYNLMTSYLLILVIPILILLYPFFYLVSKVKVYSYNNRIITVKIHDANDMIIDQIKLKRVDFLKTIKETDVPKHEGKFKYWLFEDKSHLTDKYFLTSPVNLYPIYGEVIKPVIKEKTNPIKTTTPKPIVNDNVKVESKTITKTVTNRVKLSGVTFDNRQSNISKLNINDELTLIRQRNNKYDKYAILVVDKNNNELGYIPKGTNKKYCDLYDKGTTFKSTIDYISGGGSYNYGVTIKITYDITESVQSTPKRTTTRTTSFYNDSYIPYIYEKEPFYEQYNGEDYIEEPDYDNDFDVPIDIEFY